MKTAPRPTPNTPTEAAAEAKAAPQLAMRRDEPPRPLLRGPLAVFRRPMRRPGGT
ncbi:MAG TPA: hypothetical protein VFQ81_11180 [Candidatus Limnocylindria bacterium]|nr:hypothetical protein [Candidatus Limnocylindria bacterium]